MAGTDSGYDFSALSLADLRLMLRDTLRAGDVQDAGFIRALSGEITVRERQSAR